MKSVKTYGELPYHIALLHGGPGAAGEMRPVAEELSKEFSVLECLQTQKTVDGQIEELRSQLSSYAYPPVALVGFSWGALLALLFTAKYPNLVKKLILISTPALDDKYNTNLMPVRLNRLNQQDRQEAEEILTQIASKKADNNTLKRFGQLMTLADSFDLLPEDKENINFNMEIYTSVWAEAVKLRKDGVFVDCLTKINCPIIVFHGAADPHPIEGVEKPLVQHYNNFKIIRLEKCGHTPWKEMFAKDTFYQLLKEELNYH